MNSMIKPKGVYVPLITPMLHGKYDEKSMKQLLKTLNSSVDGYVPCLSSGEGHIMTPKLREEVTKSVVDNAGGKPVYVGIKRKTHEEVLEAINTAESLGTTGITIPVLCDEAKNEGKTIAVYLQEVTSVTSLPVIIYNTEDANITTIDELITICSTCPNIIAIKDSSGNQDFFDACVQAKKEGRLNISILQGMENQLHTSREGDGYLVSLANIESKLCKDYYEKGSNEDAAKIKTLWNIYNLGGAQRYISVKTLLHVKGIISSAEDIDQLPF